MAIGFSYGHQFMIDAEEQKRSYAAVKVPGGLGASEPLTSLCSVSITNQPQLKSAKNTRELHS